MTEEGFLAALAQALGKESFELAVRAGLEERVGAGLLAQSAYIQPLGAI